MISFFPALILKVGRINMLNIPPVPRHLKGQGMLCLTINLKLYREGYTYQYAEAITVKVTPGDWDGTRYEVEREVAMACDDWSPRYRACLESFGRWFAYGRKA
jgi:hypothetical protein